MSPPEIRLIERIHKVDRKYHVLTPYTGRLIPVCPEELQSEARKLASMIDFSDVDYVIGFPMQGILPAYAVALEANLKFICAQKTKLMNQDTEVVFSEPHQPPGERDLYLYGVPAGSNVVIIDDEIKTGRTVRNAIHELEAKKISVSDIGTFVFSGRASDLDEFKKMGYDIRRLYTIDPTE
jgi:adenine/guanine phosphoribosyltransferase-like PRPP-binding protein